MAHEVLRTLIPDDAEVFPDDQGVDQFLFSDTQLNNLMEAAKGNVLRAAALANYAIATSEALISKKIKTQDLSTDGAAVASALLKKGDALMKRADKEDEETAWGFFQIIDYPVDYRRGELTEYA